MMTTSVYKPLGTRFPKEKPSIHSKLPPGGRRDAPLHKVNRVLFGPVDHVAAQRFVEEELTKITASQSKRWNFDFRNERTLDPEGVFQWRPATPKKQQQQQPQQKNVVEMEESVDDGVMYPVDVVVTPASPREVQRGVVLRRSARPQRLITDFLPKKKKSSSERFKKDWPSAVERPAKIPRLSEMS